MGFSEFFAISLRIAHVIESNRIVIVEDSVGCICPHLYDITATALTYCITKLSLPYGSSSASSSARTQQRSSAQRSFFFDEPAQQCAQCNVSMFTGVRTSVARNLSWGVALLLRLGLPDLRILRKIPYFSPGLPSPTRKPHGRSQFPLTWLDRLVELRGSANRSYVMFSGMTNKSFLQPTHRDSRPTSAAPTRLSLRLQSHRRKSRNFT